MNSQRFLYGKHEGHWQWDLAVNWFRMSNDDFHRMYGFNFVPKGMLFDKAKEYVHNGDRASSDSMELENRRLASIITRQIFGR